MRLATFNILHGRDPDTDHVDPSRLAAAVRELDADVVALQEVDRNQPRSGHADLAAVAAEAMGAVDHRFVAALSGEERPDAAGYGVALLSRQPVSAWQVVRLPGVPVPAPWAFHDQRLPHLVRDEPRVGVAAEIEVPGGGRLTVVSTHLSFLTYWNRRQLRQLVRAVRPSPRPLVLLGDLNMGPGTATRTTGMRALAAHLTFPAWRPERQIDHALADGPVTAVASRALHAGLSDHLALTVDIRLG